MGRLKLEGLFQSGLFRTSKAYRLVAADDADELVMRMKGVGYRIRESLREEHFEQGEAGGRFFCSYSLRPTPACEMTLRYDCRKETSCLNPKRSTTRVGGGVVVVVVTPVFTFMLLFRITYTLGRSTRFDILICARIN